MGSVGGLASNSKKLRKKLSKILDLFEDGGPKEGEGTREDDASLYEGKARIT